MYLEEGSSPLWTVEHHISSYEWENSVGDQVWIVPNESGNIEITPAAFEVLLRAAGYEPTE